MSDKLASADQVFSQAVRILFGNSPEPATAEQKDKLRLVTDALASCSDKGAALQEWLQEAEHTEDALAEAMLALKELREKFDLRHADAMIAHRWFAKHFGPVMDGRDFVIKCVMADVEMSRLSAAEAWLDRMRAGERPPMLNQLAATVHAANHKWWHDESGSRLERNKGEMLMLIVSEIAEAMEGERKALNDDKLPHRKMAEVELVDAMIRILDYSAAHGYDLDGAFSEKMAFNATRADHSYEARRQENGKKF